MINFIKWSDDYCVGNNLIDIHHKLFFEMVRDLSNKMGAGGQQDVSPSEILQFIQDYIKMHFNAEERIMDEAHFPDLKNHHAIHNEFSRSIQRLHKELYQAEEPYLLDKILSVTQNWFLDHILSQDKQYQEYLH
jgi:hemerythrin-like metal-binding protein